MLGPNDRNWETGDFVLGETGEIPAIPKSQ